MLLIFHFIFPDAYYYYLCSYACCTFESNIELPCYNRPFYLTTQLLRPNWCRYFLLSLGYLVAIVACFWRSLVKSVVLINSAGDIIPSYGYLQLAKVSLHRFYPNCLAFNLLFK